MIRFGVPLRSILLLGRYEKIAVSRDISIGNNYLRLLCTLPPDRERKISLMTTEEPNPITVSEEQAGPSKHTNRLIDSKSPYLLQHAHNPVDWWPWCDEALTLAKKENKLIFLSVGYSTCHWCHVMEKESFENEATARIMNENFINIKVDREERPDIDKIYMIFLMMTNGSGGWPMSIWLTPDLGPVTAGTYFPPTDRWGSVSFKKILTTIAEKWKTNPNSLRSLGTGVVTAINHSIQAGPPQDAQEQSIENKIQSAIYIFRNNYDSEWGGVMAQTKFPEISKLMLIYHLSLMRNGNDLDKMFFHTLNKIADGGIHDHVFGGFSRYSVDRQWHVPHFEKMLYDQAQLMVAYSSAFKITKNQKYLQVVDNLFKYIMKDLRHPFGGFYSGEDADSYPTIESIEKVEGAFYAWSWNEIKNIFENNENLPPNAFDIYCAFYDLTETGNVPPTSDPHGHLEGKNILIIRSTINSLAETFSTDPEAIEKIIKDGNNLLNGVREKRPRPHLDTKIITSWNGLLLTGLCKASSMSDTYKMKFLEPAKCLIDYFKKYAINPETNLLKRAMYPTQITLKLETLDNNNGFLDDYAFLINGLIDYYEATMDKEALNLADNLQIKQNELFWDVRHGGYFYTPENSANLVVRIKEDHDGAEPCGNSLSSGNLFRLYEYLGRPIYKETLEKLYSYYNAELTGYALPVMLSNAISYGEGGFSVLVVGGHNEDSENLMNIIRSFHIPGLLLYQIDPNSDNNLSKGSMDITKFTMIKDKPTVYICQKNACQLPINDPDVIKKNLEEIYRNNFEAQN